MKFSKVFLGLMMVLFLVSVSWAQSSRWAIIVTTSSAETAWNALRLARFALKEGHQVSLFFLGEGVTVSQEEKEPFNVKELLEDFHEQGGKVYACKACLRIHQLKPSQSCPVGTLKILHQLVEEADKVLVF